jgi:hypothetical protein
MDRPGRPSLYEPAFAEQAFELCLAGATNQDLADTFEVGHSTIDNWLQKRPEFAQSVKRGRALADGRVAHGLYSRAVGYTYESTRVVLHRGEPVSVPQGATAPSRRRTRDRGGAPWPRRPSRRVLPPRPKLQDQPRWTLLQDTRSPSWRAMRLSTKRFGNVVASRF